MSFARKAGIVVGVLPLLWAMPALAQAAGDAAQRVADLNAKLTTEERMVLVRGQFARTWRDQLPPAEAISSAGYVAGVPRLSIPALYETDASLGVANPGGARKGDRSTALPSGMAMAATFDPAIAYSGGAMIGAEARAKGFNVLLAGGINLDRNPANGRNFEYAGEDPLLAGTMVGASIRGIQSNRIVSTIKHFALNDQETGRHVVNAVIDEAALRESDLLAFELAIEQGHPGAVMCAYNQVNGAYACGNDFLLNRVLKQDWHYPGWVMSDWGAVYATDFAAKGLDQESGEQLDDHVWFAPALLRGALADGTLSPARLADMTGRILRGMADNGLLDHAAGKPEGTIDFAAHRAVAQQEAAAAIVLLKNEGDALPLAASAKRILIVGGYADRGVLSGGGSSQVLDDDDPVRSVTLPGFSDFGSPRIMRFQGTPPLDAIRARVPGAQVSFDDGHDPAATAARAKAADVVIVFANQWTDEGEDAPDLSLPGGQDALIDAVAAANPHTVVVLQTGGAVAMPWLGRTAAVVEAWYGGSGGGDAIADVLIGAVNPSGRLPITFPASTSQYPRFHIPAGPPESTAHFDSPHPEGADVGYKWLARTGGTPLFPFGHGLSYTRFTYSAPRVAIGARPSVTFAATNTGARAGATVPQLYLISIGGRPVRRLAGFRKVMLAPGETRPVALTIDPRLLARFDVARQRWIIDGGRYTFALATSATDAGKTVVVTLSARTWRY